MTTEEVNHFMFWYDGTVLFVREHIQALGDYHTEFVQGFDRGYVLGISAGLRRMVLSANLPLDVRNACQRVEKQLETEYHAMTSGL